MTSKKTGKKASKATNRKASQSGGRAKKLSTTFRASFENNPEFAQFGSNALSMFALSLYLRIEDLDEFASSADVGQGDDKKVDICHLNISDGIALIAQNYVAAGWNKQAAPANKASDLNTAMAWMLSADERKIPAHLRSKAKDLRQSLMKGEIKRIELLYIHNCPESENVDNELRVVADATLAKVTALLEDAPDDVRASDVTIFAREIGLQRIEELYRSRDSEIYVDSLLTLPMVRPIEESGDGWKALLGTVSAGWIQKLYREHGDRLFSANYREYLGSTARKENINRHITETANQEPSNFWVYNNGVTALTHEIRLGRSKKIRGISIINGAQTTGALTDAGDSGAASARVMMRIVECSSKDLVDNIIKYNNTQNDIKPADRRSKDHIQKRLREEFGNYSITYVHRRSGVRSIANAITCMSIGAPLCAFHGDPQTSFRNANDIFNDDGMYNKVFPPSITAEHIFLVRALSVAIDRVRAEVKLKVANGTATDLEQKQHDVLRFAASKHFILYTIGELADQIMKRPVTDRYNWKCVKGVISADNVSLIKAWTGVLNTLLPPVTMFIDREGKDAAYMVPRSSELSKKVAHETKVYIAALPAEATSQFEPLRAKSSI